MRAATRVSVRCPAAPARCARTLVPAPRTASRGYADHIKQAKTLESPVPDNVVRNGGLTNASKWFAEVLKRGPMGTLRTILKMDEVRWGTLVGKDQFGNKYFENNVDYIYGRSRWVEYADKVDPTLIPAEWHGWMHHTIDTPVALDKTYLAPKFQSPWYPHLTGTDSAYQPHNHPLNAAYQPRERIPLEKWNPQNPEEAVAAVVSDVNAEQAGLLTRSPLILSSNTASESATKSL